MNESLIAVRHKFHLFSSLPVLHLPASGKGTIWGYPAQKQIGLNLNNHENEVLFIGFAGWLVDKYRNVLLRLRIASIFHILGLCFLKCSVWIWGQEVKIVRVTGNFRSSTACASLFLFIFVGRGTEVRSRCWPWRLYL